MHILVTNDDGPPSNQSSPYVHSLVHALQTAGHTVSVVLPHQQRSWIGKAHIVGASVKPTYFRPGTLHHDDGTIHQLPRGYDGDDSDEDGDEWVLIDSTPASCVQIGLYHYFQNRGPVDLVVSGPNYGRNTTALFALSSGTVGGAMEAAVCGKRAIALSFAFSSRNHDPIIIAEASKHSVRVIEYLHSHWDDGVDLYTVNVPLEPGVSENKVLYTHMLDNRWTSGSCFEAINATESGEQAGLQEQHLREKGESKLTGIESSGSQTPRKNPFLEHKHFKWAPNFTDVYRSVEESKDGNDGWVVKEGMTSVTALRANFMHTPGIKGEIKLSNKKPDFYCILNYEDKYVQPLLEELFRPLVDQGNCQIIQSMSELSDPTCRVLQYMAYEDIDFDHILSRPSTSLANSYVIRKALIRKHYLSTTIANWISKYPKSNLQNHFKPAVDFELDFSEFLDEALLEAYELRESLERNETKSPSEQEWWILKPGMSDRGQGIRLFNSEAQLQEIFEEWDVDESESEEDYDTDPGPNSQKGQGIVTSQLRHFIAQPYIHPPLLLPSSSGRKFHIRTYVLAVGSLKVYVFREMLALFAEKPYQAPWEEDDEVRDLSRHLTNTCLQENGSSVEGSVRRYWDLEESAPGLSQGWKDDIFNQICSVTGEVFEAAARGMLVHFQTLPNVFELYGLDFLVDAAGQSWLLEVNAYPDFGQTGEELKRRVVGRLFEATIKVAIQPFFRAPGTVGEDSDLRLVANLNLRSTS
ncbi:putative acid phosphatase [Talaromyces proteolyticus]|uniref:Acid phosphatase n=1 Tax=Talaromyces proteolyticus TaxID=1131652 RepID=A0AAD4KS68_9EURO|nr:putative acid phosphatase [Talaromyces proteolyticus]KAH8695357.1 putative acid phosphatase [Talaromyces proteolyticus]